GVAHRGQPRARRVARSGACGTGRARRRRPDRRRGLPLARGPHRQTCVRRAVHLTDPRGSARRTSRARPRIPPADPRRREGRRAGDRAQPACGLRTTARGRTDWSGCLMTAPARPRPQPAERRRQSPRRAPRQAPAAAPDVVGSPKRRSSAAERAYARRAQRADALRRQAQQREQPEPTRLRLRLRWPRSRASFVLMLMALMAVGVATTLWLSTQAISDSYRLEELRQSNADLAERSEELQRAVATAEAPGQLAERAEKLGMVPGGNPARLVVGDDGKVRVVGEPEAAHKPAPPAPPADQSGDRTEG